MRKVGGKSSVDTSTPAAEPVASAASKKIADQSAGGTPELSPKTLETTQGPITATKATVARAQELDALKMAVGGLHKALIGNTPAAKLDERTRQLLSQIDEAFEDPASLAVFSAPGGAKLSGALAELLEPIQARLSELGADYQSAVAAKDAKQARAIEGAYNRLIELHRFAEAAVNLGEGQIETSRASDLVLGLCSGRECLMLAQALPAVASIAKLSEDDVATALRWLVGTKSEVGLGEPERLYAAIKAQAQGQVAKTPGGLALPAISSGTLIRNALGSLELLARVAEETKPSNAQALINSLEAALEVRTSKSHPLQVAWVPTSTPGKLAVTLAPGKTQPSLYDYFWKRDLDADLSALSSGFGINVLVPLIEDHELETLRIPKLVSRAEAHGMSVRRLQIPDQHTPSIQDATQLTQDIVDALKAGKNVLIHCKGGLGRAGTVAAATLIRLGVGPEDAINAVREARPGAVENKKQELFLFEFASLTTPIGA